MRFFPCSTLIAVLPPTDESTWAKRVVGTWIYLIPLKKVAIELNQEIIDKNHISKIKLKKNDIIEIVHFIGGG